ncbi:MAG: acyl-CoA dehydrogenase family protein [Candidatus Bathyarchaeota archaeon]|nr:MAG: acyl-CoA dehydrogenase family protein [Candidatus Bathyarchaeota archaeon]UCE57975.1 MAG: acyl-CoA dehydrogenase family protein [Candidatus Bathyarchaeota archaeon]
MEFELTEEQEDIKNAAREFAEKEFTAELGRKIDEKYEFPWMLYRKAAKLGFIGGSLPEEHGGQGLGCIEDCIVAEEFNRVDSTCAHLLSGIGFAALVPKFGTEEQNKKYVPRICKGEIVCAMALTEPNHGSDAGMVGLETTAVKDRNEWVINGAKTYITCGEEAEFVMVCCQTDPNAQPPYRGVSMIIVEKGTKGFDTNSLKPKLGFRGAPQAELSFDNVRIPLGNLLGQENRGFHQIMSYFDFSRIPIAAGAIGIAQGAYESSLKYSTQREQFFQPIANFQVTQFKIAEMATKIETARLLTYKAAWLVENKPEQRRLVTKISSMAKAYAAKISKEVTDEAIQIHGGVGYVDSDIERHYRDTRINDIIEGTGEIQKYIVARECYREIGFSV